MLAALLISVYMGFTVAMSYLCGAVTYDFIRKLDWMKNQKTFAACVGIFVWIFFVKYGWPFYFRNVVEVFA